MFPNGGFAPWLAVQNKTSGSLQGVVPKLNKNGFNISEMQALYNVLGSPSALGTSRNTTLLALCTANPTTTGCGYLFYLNVFSQRKMQVGVNASSDPLIIALNKNIQNLFCQSSETCLRITSSHMFKAISDYVTIYLAKMALHLVIDKIDFGPVMTRTVKQLSQGFVETRLRIPGIAPNGFGVAGFLPTDSEGDVSKKANKAFYTCESSRSFQWAGMVINTVHLYV